ncbi:MAG TPA: hypothetical protein VN420_01840 [Candidatus Fimivivens sp.]|nr:hypothetical protein [Candidatus Fimivivens sp.]
MSEQVTSKIGPFIECLRNDLDGKYRIISVGKENGFATYTLQNRKGPVVIDIPDTVVRFEGTGSIAECPTDELRKYVLEAFKNGQWKLAVIRPPKPDELEEIDGPPHGTSTFR